MARVLAHLAALRTTRSALEQRYLAIPAIDLATSGAREMRKILWDEDQAGFTGINNLLGYLEQIVRIYNAMIEPDEDCSDFLDEAELGTNNLKELLDALEIIVAGYEGVTQNRIEQTVRDLVNFFESVMDES
ncbi:hypothetical protein K470DRAFT_261754 [Piedraia hortae CBS 480.64]|uniref:Uncharacterized protein n=1 Tax=Piedraia hortae CBS 480.64 TaxID=1314780 RepID=A0A6A7C928_9PEZI|nr:hypothetical protein K470DRAFT_261754 [Piedraia hortae CBS 480.64]